MNDRHVLITGGAGYIGSLLTSELLRANYRVTVLDSLLFGGELLVPFLHHPNFHFVKADVTEPRADKRFHSGTGGKSLMQLSIWQQLSDSQLVRLLGSRWPGAITSRRRKWSSGRQ